MKKFLAFLFLITLLSSLSACNIRNTNYDQLDNKATINDDYIDDNYFDDDYVDDDYFDDSYIDDDYADDGYVDDDYVDDSYVDDDYVDDGYIDDDYFDDGYVEDTVPLQTLHIIDKDAYYYAKDITDLYGNVYDGPYYEFCSYGSSSKPNKNITQNYMTFYTNGEYQRLIGTFFTRTNQNDSYAIELLVYADGELVFCSEPITRRTQAVDLDVDINYCSELRITARSYDYTSTGTNPGIILVNAMVIK